MAEDLNGYFSLMFTTDDISSLPVPDAKFHEAKSDYLRQLTVIPEMVAKKIEAMKIINHLEWMESSKTTNGNSRISHFQECSTCH